MITIFCATTANYELSNFAIEKTINNLPMDSKVVTFSDRPIHKKEKLIKIPKFKDAIDYNRFMLSKFSNYIDTTHFLVVQYDGFAVNKDNWDDSFLEYDYIGAPWIHKSGPVRVGNGGFSLRSIKLQKAIEKEGLGLLGNKKFGGQEDRIICDYNKQLLEEKYNIKFAPLGIAQKFSYEKGKPNFNTLGFHGFWNVPYFLEDTDLKYYTYRLNDESGLKKKRIKNNMLKKHYSIL